MTPSRRFGLRATPALTRLIPKSDDLSVAPCRRSSKLIDWPFTLYFALNPAPMPVPTYQWPPGYEGSASAAAEAGANPGIPQDKPAQLRARASASSSSRAISVESNDQDRNRSHALLLLRSGRLSALSGIPRAPGRRPLVLELYAGGRNVVCAVLEAETGRALPNL